MPGEVVVVFTGGDPVPADALVEVPADAFVVAADAGVGRALDAGRRVDVAVGDFDSVPPSVLEAAAERGAVVIRHPPDKDATDLELALDVAAARHPESIVVVGGAGGRVDHFLGNALLLAATKYAPFRMRAVMADVVIDVVHDSVAFTGDPGATVSLFPVHGPARGVSTTGLRWGLDDEVLEPGSSRGVSNELAAPEASVRVADGVVVVVRARRAGAGTPD